MSPHTIDGGAFITTDADVQTTFTPEQLTEEQRMIKQSVLDFIKLNADRFDHKDQQQALLRETGQLGLVGAHIPESYGGLEMDKDTVTAILEALGHAGGSFDTTFAAHTGIGMLPILYFGTEAQKAKYLPALCTGEDIAAYCLTEPGSGSDALAAKSTAVYDAAIKAFKITGQKVWISNAGFANIFVVFAQVAPHEDVQGSGFTGFLIKSDNAGIRLGVEEEKMGIQASSTRQVFFEDAVVAADQVLGEIGKGHHIAFNVLNIGRFKLANLCMGGMKRILKEGIAYAKERHQFGQSIADFGAIRYKIAESGIRTFALESMVYRVSNMLRSRSDELSSRGKTFEEALRASAESYAIECALIKVYGSEALDYAVDELVQILGGNGYSEEYNAARLYRDARINRIYEGTNEINRLLSIKLLMKRVLSGELDMTDAAWAVQKELTKMPSFAEPTGELGYESRAIANFKKLLLLTAGAAVKYQMDGHIDIAQDQQLTIQLADIMIHVFLAESAYLRVKQRHEAGDPNLDWMVAALSVLLHDAQDTIAKLCRDALASFARGDEKRILLMGIQRFANYPAQHVNVLRDQIAGRMLAVDGYILA